jgi:lipopolysaccharide export system protein LptC
MPLKFSFTLPLVVLMFIALISFWIENYVQLPKLSAPSKVKLHQPDYFMENFVTRKTDKHGQLKSMLAATKLEHFYDDDSIHIERPRFSEFSGSAISNQIEAQKGLISAGGEVAEFFDHVIATRPKSNKSEAMSLQTQYLKILPNKNIATTPQFVRITQGDSSYMTGTGMTYNSETRDLSLNKNVRIHYQSNQSVKKIAQPAIPSNTQKTKPTKPLRKGKAMAKSKAKP